MPVVPFTSGLASQTTSAKMRRTFIHLVNMEFLTLLKIPTDCGFPLCRIPSFRGGVVFFTFAVRKLPVVLLLLCR